MRLLACARVASVDNREVYYAPAAGLASMVTAAPVKGERDAVAVSPRNETAACALVLELLSEAGAAAAAVLPAARACATPRSRPPTPSPRPLRRAPRRCRRGRRHGRLGPRWRRSRRRARRD